MACPGPGTFPSRSLTGSGMDGLKPGSVPGPGHELLALASWRRIKPVQWRTGDWVSMAIGGAEPGMEVGSSGENVVRDPRICPQRCPCVAGQCWASHFISLYSGFTSLASVSLNGWLLGDAFTTEVV